MLSGAMLAMDSTTMVLVLALGNLALCSMLFFFDYGAVRAPALASWGLSKQVQAAAWILLALGGARVVPEPLALPGGWALLIGGVGVDDAQAGIVRRHLERVAQGTEAGGESVGSERGGMAPV